MTAVADGSGEIRGVFWTLRWFVVELCQGLLDVGGVGEGDSVSNIVPLQAQKTKPYNTG